jgi:NADH-quinone oxidoreductase subunit E/NADP-reducing hydrogenase subunit HndA
MKPEAQRETYNAETLPAEGYKALDEYIEASTKDEAALIGVLHKAQTIFGYLPKDVQLYVGRKLNVSGAKVFGVVSFYSYFTTKPVGKHKINVCTGTACYVKGVEKVFDQFKKELGIENNQTTEDMMFTLRDVRCVGACGLAPVVVIGEKVYGHVQPGDVKEILASYKEGDNNEN